MGSSLNDPLVLNGPVTFTSDVIMQGGFTPPAGKILSSHIAASADLSADKLQHRHSKSYDQVGGTDVVSATRYIHLARAVGVIKSIRVRPITAPVGGDKGYTVDLRKVADASGTSSTLLTALIQFQAGDADNTLKSGTLIATPSLAVNDAVLIVVATFGSTGSQGQGFIIDVQIDESGI